MRKTKYTVKYTTGFKKDYKRAIKRGLKSLTGSGSHIYKLLLTPLHTLFHFPINPCPECCSSPYAWMTAFPFSSKDALPSNRITLQVRQFSQS